MKVIVALIWLLPLVGVLIGGFILIGGMASANSSPQEAVIVSLSLACAILPYCFSRALTEIITALSNKN